MVAISFWCAFHNFAFSCLPLWRWFKRGGLVVYTFILLYFLRTVGLHLKESGQQMNKTGSCGPVGPKSCLRSTQLSMWHTVQLHHWAFPSGSLHSVERSTELEPFLKLKGQSFNRTRVDDTPSFPLLMHAHRHIAHISPQTHTRTQGQPKDCLQFTSEHRCFSAWQTEANDPF